MPSPLSGPGVGLALPQNLYPSELQNAPYDAATPQLCLAAGDAIPIPAGTWAVGLGLYCFLEWLDPVTATWKITASAAWQSGLMYVKSDGFNFRIANRTGCPVGAAITNAGSGYVQASTSIAVTGGGGSTWSPIVGGQLGNTTITGFGAGYGVAPIVIIPAPPPPANNANGVGGIPASGYATINAGTVSGFTFTNPGAGYPSAPTIVVVPNPTDPNINSGITAATITVQTIATGSITGALCTNMGAPLSNPNNITLSFSGVGSSATATAAMAQTVAAGSVVGSFTVGGVSGGLITSAGGSYPTSVFTNSPETLGLAARPREARIGLSVGGVGTVAAQVGTIVDSGMFFSAPTPILQTLNTTVGVGSVTGTGTIVFTMGSRPDIVILQPAP